LLAAAVEHDEERRGGEEQGGEEKRGLGLGEASKEIRFPFALALALDLALALGCPSLRGGICPLLRGVWQKSEDIIVRSRCQTICVLDEAELLVGYDSADYAT